MAERPQNRNLKRGGSPGRPKGVPNKVTQEAREVAQRLVGDPKYQAQLVQRLEAGKLAPGVEVMLWNYAYGKPKEQVDVNVTSPLVEALATALRKVDGDSD